METSTETVKGQTVIPSKIRKKFGLKSGAIVHFIHDDNEIKIVPVTREVINSNFGIFNIKCKFIKTLKEDKKREREL